MSDPEDQKNLEKSHALGKELFEKKASVEDMHAAIRDAFGKGGGADNSTPDASPQDDTEKTNAEFGARRRDDNVKVNETVVLPLIDENDFPHFRRHFGWPLFRTYAEWLDAACLDDELRRRRGIETKRVHIRFAQAIDLCAEKEVPRNYQSLIRALTETTAQEPDKPA